jgi:transcriptional regulator with XRE-family HTH domain
VPEKDEGDLLTAEDRTFARSMRAAREARGWTQGELAGRLGASGFEWMSQVTISRIEQLKRAARLGEAYAIAAAFGLPLSVMTAPSAGAAMLSTVLDRPREASAALEQLRIAAARVGYLWGDLRKDLAFAERLREDMSAAEFDEEAQTAFEHHQAAAGRLLEHDPVTEVQRALEDPDAAAELTTWRMRED